MVGTTAYLVSLTMHRLARARAFVKECLLLCVLIAIKPEEGNMVVILLVLAPETSLNLSNIIEIK